MTSPSTYTFARYLEAKRSVDDRALHRPTLDRLHELLATRTEPVRVVEVGCGTGTLLRRLIEWDVLPDRVVYDGYDLRPEAVKTATERLPAWASERGYAVETPSRGVGDPCHLVDEGAGRRLTATFETADVLAVAETTDREWDLLVGCAFLDLVDLDASLESLLALVPDGLAYFPITFDGETVLRPVPEPAVERAVLDAYHATMDQPDRPGGSHTGRALFEAIPDADAEVVAAGGSDWVVTPPYPDDEAYFLHHLVHGIEDAVVAALDDGDAATATVQLSRGAVESWAAERHDAIANGQLTFAAHNFDVLARVGATDGSAGE